MIDKNSLFESELSENAKLCLGSNCNLKYGEVKSTSIICILYLWRALLSREIFCSGVEILSQFESACGGYVCSGIFLKVDFNF